MRASFRNRPGIVVRLRCRRQDDGDLATQLLVDGGVDPIPPAPMRLPIRYRDAIGRPVKPASSAAMSTQYSAAGICGLHLSLKANLRNVTRYRKVWVGERDPTMLKADSRNSGGSTDLRLGAMAGGVGNGPWRTPGRARQPRRGR